MHVLAGISRGEEKLPQLDQLSGGLPDLLAQFPPSALVIRHILDRLYSRARTEYPRFSEQDLRLSLSQMMAVVMFVLFSPAASAPLLPLNLSDARGRRHYVEFLTHKYFPV